jgi:GNAT superfamily N-acetyltransferase
MDELRLVPAHTVGEWTLTQAFNRAFEGYFVPMAQTPASLLAMIAQTDVSLADSIVALDPDDAPAGIGLMAVRPPRGWIAGMGLAVAWRGQGLGASMMRPLIDRARALGLARLQLEVLEQNTPARRLYTKLGFVEERPLLVFKGAPLALAEYRAPHADAGPQAVPVAEALEVFDAMHIVAPSWQRERATLGRLAGDLQALGLVDAGSLSAYVLYSQTDSGTSLLDAGARGATHALRQMDVGALVYALVARMPRAPIRAINVPPGDPLEAVLTALGCPLVSRQQEMMLPLGA